jgi:hypothetical protein
MRWAGYVARMGAKRNAWSILVVKTVGNNHYKDLDVGGSILLKWILEK